MLFCIAFLILTRMKWIILIGKKNLVTTKNTNFIEKILDILIDKNEEKYYIIKIKTKEWFLSSKL